TLGLTDFVWDLSKFFADAGTVFVAGVIISFLYDSVSKKIADLYQDETISWFIDRQTKLKSIFADLKRIVVGYDVHSELLSLEMYNMTKDVHLDAFVGDICDKIVQAQEVKDFSYYRYLI